MYLNGPASTVIVCSSLCFFSPAFILCFSLCVLDWVMLPFTLMRIQILPSMYRVTEYTECQAFWPVVGFGSPHTLTHKGVLLLLPLGRGDTLTCRGGGGEPNSDEGTDALVLCVYYNPCYRRQFYLIDNRLCFLLTYGTYHSHEFK